MKVVDVTGAHASTSCGDVGRGAGCRCRLCAVTATVTGGQRVSCTSRKRSAEFGYADGRRLVRAAPVDCCGVASAAPANDVYQLAGALHGQPARSNEQRINDVGEPAHGSPGNVIHAIALFSHLPNYRPVSVISRPRTPCMIRLELLSRDRRELRQGCATGPDVLYFATAVAAHFGYRAVA